MSESHLFVQFHCRLLHWLAALTTDWLAAISLSFVIKRFIFPAVSFLHLGLQEFAMPRLQTNANNTCELHLISIAVNLKIQSMPWDAGAVLIHLLRSTGFHF